MKRVRDANSTQAVRAGEPFQAGPPVKAQKTARAKIWGAKAEDSEPWELLGVARRWGWRHDCTPDHYVWNVPEWRHSFLGERLTFLRLQGPAETRRWPWVTAG